METTKEEYLNRAKKLHESSKCFLAIKAYEQALDPQKTDAAFKDFLLRCNAQSVSVVGTNDKVAEDFLYICLKSFQNRNYIVGDLQRRRVVAAPSQEDMSIMFLLSVTLNNWGCVLLRLGEVDAALHVFPGALEASQITELSCAILLNICFAQTRKCSFAEARETAKSILEEMGDTEDVYGQSDSFFEDEDARIDFRGLLTALTYHAMAIIEEFLSPNTADEHYEKARHTLQGNPYQQWSALMENNQRKFRDFVQRRREEMMRRREQAEAEAAAAMIATQTDLLVRRSAKGGRTKIGQGSGRKGKQNKKSQKNISTHPIEGEPIDLPPIDGDLKWELQRNGLSCSAVSIFSLKDVGQHLFNDEHSVEEFESPFVVSGAASMANNVAMIMIFEETPLQVADYLQEGCTRSKKTIWSLYLPRRMDASFPDERTKTSAPTSPLSPVNLKPFMPAPLSDRAIETAKRSVAALEKLLGQRLITLLRAEAVFEERWRATSIVKSALTAFNAAQGIIRLKMKIKEERTRRAILEDASARRIVRFFREYCTRNQEQMGPLRGRGFTVPREEAAAIVLQKYTRRWVAVQTLRSLQAEHQAMIAHVVAVQALYRGCKARREYRTFYEERRAASDAKRNAAIREFAAIRIQRVYRRHAWRIHRWLDMGDDKTAILHHYLGSRVYYAVLIQKVFRGFRVRQKYGAEVYAQRCYGRNRYHAAIYHASATHIQRVFRGHRVRRVTREPLRQRLAQRAAVRAAKRRRHEEDAARTIQCAYRSCVARRRARALREAQERERLLRRRRVYVPFCLEEQVY